MLWIMDFYQNLIFFGWEYQPHKKKHTEKNDC